MPARFGAALFGLLLVGGIAHGQSLFLSSWLGTGPDANWSTAANWQFATVPTSGPNALLVFGGNTGANPAVTTAVVDAAIGTSGSPAAFELSQLQFSTFNIPYTLSAGPGAPPVRFVAPDVSDVDDIVVQAGRTAASAVAFPITTGTAGLHTWTNNGTGGLTVSGPVTISNTRFSIQGSGDTTANGAIGLGAAVFLVTGSGTVTLNGVVSSSPTNNGIVYSGTGTLVLGGANTYSGTTTVGGTGTVRLAGGADRLPVGTTVQFNADGRLDLNGNDQQFLRPSTSGGATAAARIVNTSATPATLTLTPTGDVSFLGTFGGPGGNNFGFTLNASASFNDFTLTAAHTYTGPTVLQAGGLRLQGSGSLASPTITVGAGTLFDARPLTGGQSYDATTDRLLVRPNQTLRGTGSVFGGVVAGAGSTVQAGTGGANEVLTINGGLRLFGGGQTAPASTLRVVAAAPGGTPTASRINVTQLDGTGVPSAVDVFVGTNAPINIVLIDGGGFTVGQSYTIVLATAPAVARTGTTVTTAAGGETYTFAASDYTLTSPDFVAFEGVQLQAVGGQLRLTFAPVPEPGCALGLAVLGLAAVWRRRRSSPGSSGPIRVRRLTSPAPSPRVRADGSARR